MKQVRKNPCSSCPYRQGVPSGIWSQEEYDKLPQYDADTALQPPNAFACHQTGGGTLCGGWVAVHGAYRLLSVRLEVGSGLIDPEIFDYQTKVPVFASGAEARDHGMRDIENPSEEAREMVVKIVETRMRVGSPVEFA